MGDTRLLINGNEYAIFSDLKLFDAIDTFSIGCTFTMPNKPENRQIVKPAHYETVQIFYHNHLIFSGQVFDVNVDDIKTVNLTGYSRSKHLENTQLSFANYPRTFIDVSLLTVMYDLIGDINFIDNRKNNKLVKIDKLEIKETENIADFLTKVCRDNNIVIAPNINNDGLQWLDNAKYIDVEPIKLHHALLFANFSISFKGSEMYSRVECLTSKTTKNEPTSIKALNKFVKHERVKVAIKSDDSTETNDDFLKRTNAKIFKDMFTFTIDYPKITDERGNLIRAGSVFELYNPAYYINKKIKMVIRNITYNLNDITCKFECSPLDLYTDNIKDFWNE